MVLAKPDISQKKLYLFYIRGTRRRLDMPAILFSISRKISLSRPNLYMVYYEYLVPNNF